MYRRKWTPAERHALRHYARARAYGSDSDYTAEQWSTLCTFFGAACLACGAMPVTVDHVVPLSRGGSNTITNIQPLCCSCNARKGTRTVDYRDPLVLAQVLEMLP